ncbi:hypothetical protein [Ruegeria arenilitoris]|uniref:hypothetical protein n=1 Tax=Ruegeria arenilitoris TaxID=1173585 RepID=UPI00147DFC99|nr:hypothetical protein [Ruegeria arenilitoris]
MTTAKKPIASTGWIKFGDALAIAAKELLGTELPNDFLNNPESRTYRDALKDLRKAIESNAVTVLIDGGKSVVTLDIAKARHFATTIDVDKSVIFIEGHPHLDFRAEINEAEFRRFLFDQRKNRNGRIANANRERDCLYWLQDRLHLLKPGKKEPTRIRAMEFFDINSTAFDRVWDAAISGTRFEFLRDGGAPKK